MELIVSGWGRDHGEKVIARRDLTEARSGSFGGYARPEVYLTSVPTTEPGAFEKARVVENGSLELRFYAKIVLNGEYLVRQTISRREIAKLFLSQYDDCSFRELLNLFDEIRESRRSRNFPPVMLKPVGDLGLSDGALAWLSKNNIWHVGDLVQKSEGQLRDLPDFDLFFIEIRDHLTPLGLQFGMEVQGWPAIPPQLLTRIDDLELSVRAANCLKNEGIKYVGELVLKSEAELLRAPNFGRKGVDEIRGVLAEMGLRLGLEANDWQPGDIENIAWRFSNR